jgi:hypothetical protein
MAIDRADLSGSPDVNPMAPVVLTSAAQNQAAPEGGQSKPRRREPSAEKDPAEKDPAEESPAADTDRPPHRIDSLA